MAILTIGALIVAAVPGSGALYFSNRSLQETDAQIQIAEQGQITDRYNAAISNLGSTNIEVRLGGIYALQRIMQDSPRDQPTVIAVLCAFVRDQTSANIARADQSVTPLPTDIQAALTVVTSRDRAHDGSTTVVDFSGANLTTADLAGADLIGAKLEATNLTLANLANANLTHADMEYANLTHAYLAGANFSHADLACALGAEYVAQAPKRIPGVPTGPPCGL